MLERFVYKNHINEEISFGYGGIYVNSNDLHDYSWGYVSKNDKISAFKKGIVRKTIPVVIMCDSEEEGIEIRNKLFECAEKDVLAMQHGQIIIGDYYLDCYITGSKKKGYSISKRQMQTTLEIVTEYPAWVKESTTMFTGSEAPEGSNLDYNNDFPYDYSSNLFDKPLLNSDFVAEEFRMNIFGACVNPKITISGHDYQVNASIEADEYIQIDSKNKTIIKVGNDGTVTNLFNLRNRDSYIFEKIPVGENTVSTNGNFRFDVTLLEERGEPKWI